MRKLIVACMVGVMALSLFGCGTDKEDSKDNSAKKAETTVEESKAPEYGWFDAEVPEGFVAQEDEVGAFRTDDGTDRVFKIYTHSRTFESAEEARQKSIDFWDDNSHKDGGEVTLGNYTWYVEKFDWNSNDSCIVYTDIDDNTYVEIAFFEMSFESDEVQNFLNSFKTMETDNLYDASVENPIVQ